MHMASERSSRGVWLSKGRPAIWQTEAEERSATGGRSVGGKAGVVLACGVAVVEVPRWVAGVVAAWGMGEEGWKVGAGGKGAIMGGGAGEGMGRLSGRGEGRKKGDIGDFWRWSGGTATPLELVGWRYHTDAC